MAKPAPMQMRGPAGAGTLPSTNQENIGTQIRP
jgi:hypothetical protein